MRESKHKVVKYCTYGHSLYAERAGFRLKLSDSRGPPAASWMWWHLEHEAKGLQRRPIGSGGVSEEARI